MANPNYETQCHSQTLCNRWSFTCCNVGFVMLSGRIISFRRMGSSKDRTSETAPDGMDNSRPLITIATCEQISSRPPHSSPLQPFLHLPPIHERLRVSLLSIINHVRQCDSKYSTRECPQKKWLSRWVPLDPTRIFQ